MMPHKTYSMFAKRALTTALALAGLPLLAQMDGTLKAPPAGDRAQRIAAAEAEFPRLLAQALSPESVQAMLARIKEMSVGDVTGLTTFDNVTAPCFFDETVALRGPEQYAEFSAPGNNGGAILNVCSDFGITAHSPPNFLAFNNQTTLDDGGTPKLPELIGVGRQRSSVSMWVSGGDGSGYPIAVVALGPGGVVGIVNTTTASDWVQISLAGPGIDAIALVGNPYVLLIDDIQSE